MRTVLHRTHRNKKYTTINLTCVEDPTVSGLGKAIHLYAMSRPKDWELRVPDLVKRFKEGKHAIRAALNELLQADYTYREEEQGRQQQRNGRFGFGSAIYHWFENPDECKDFKSQFVCTDFQCTEVLCTEVLCTEVLCTENQDVYLLPNLEDTSESKKHHPDLFQRDARTVSSQPLPEPWRELGRKYLKAFPAQTRYGATAPMRELYDAHDGEYEIEWLDQGIDLLVAAGVTDCPPWQLAKFILEYSGLTEEQRTEIKDAVKAAIAGGSHE